MVGRPEGRRRVALESHHADRTRAVGAVRKDDSLAAQSPHLGAQLLVGGRSIGVRGAGQEQVGRFGRVEPHVVELLVRQHRNIVREPYELVVALPHLVAAPKPSADRLRVDWLSGPRLILHQRHQTAAIEGHW